MWLQGSSAGSVISRRQLLHSFTPFLRDTAERRGSSVLLPDLRRGGGWLLPHVRPGAGMKPGGHFCLASLVSREPRVTHHRFKNQRLLSCLRTIPAWRGNGPWGGWLGEGDGEPGCSGELLSLAPHLALEGSTLLLGEVPPEMTDHLQDRLSSPWLHRCGLPLAQRG